LNSLESRTMRQEDWTESWKKHFHTFRASERIVVKPSWESAEKAPGDIILELDPGMCFGTGYHGTTKACLQFLDQLQKEVGSEASFLDAGCGSGILSIAARLLGYLPVFAFDNDQQAVLTAQENLLKAGFSEVVPTMAELEEYLPPKPCRVVAANILATVLIQHAEQILKFMATDGKPTFLILSGILNQQYADVKRRFENLGCKEINTITIEEWSSGCFRTDTRR
jgi:ribosomal protein L11 methyltransferase